MIAGLFLLSVLYVAIVVALAVSGRREGLLVSLGCFAATLAAGWWHISISRSSTASIGFVFLPSVAAISGMIALGFGAARRRRGALAHALAMASILVAAVIPATEVVAGVQTKRLNARRDRDQSRRENAVQKHRREIRDLLVRVPERRADTLTALARANRTNREFLVAVLAEYGVDPTLLDTMAQSPDRGIALQAVRNLGTDSATLRRVYHSKSSRSYFLQSLAAHSHTPPDILREIHRLRPAAIMGLEIWFAQNPFTPTDVIDDIARTITDPHVARQLVRHPAVDCAMLQTIASRIGEALHDDETLARRLRQCSGSELRSSAAGTGATGRSNAHR